VVGPQAFPVIGRWSDARHDLPMRTRAFLVDSVGPGVPWVFPQPVNPPESRLTSVECAELAGDGIEVRCEASVRQEAAWGMALPDLLRSRPQGVPDAVLVPMNPASVSRIIEWCDSNDVVIVPRGGGTSVVGGLVGPGGDRRWVSVDVSRLTHIDAPDLVDDVIRVGPGVTGPALESALTDVGRIFGHYPQSWERATIGGYAATRSAGQNSTGYGRIEDLIVAADLATPSGTWQLGHIPATSVGPNLLRYALGSEGTLGIFTSLTLRIRPRPEVRRAEGAMAPDWQAGTEALRALAQHSVAPSVIRLSDPAETRGTWRMSAPTGLVGSALDGYLRVRGAADGCLLIMDWHGSRSTVRAQRAQAWRILRQHGVVSLGASVGRKWVQHRFDGPYLRDQLVHDGYFVETFETAAPWSALHALHARVEDVVAAALSRYALLAHISHVYSAGASIYFTLIAPADVVTQWSHLKRRITDTILAAGGTASHHHGVGVDHAPWLAAEVGPVGMRVIRAVKQAVDPNDIMNPGILAGAVE
jgi:alkyldihydroxyacetonephosphate synthase